MVGGQRSKEFVDGVYEILNLSIVDVQSGFELR
jgi:hypothetical protein